MAEIIIIGASGHAGVIMDIIEQQGRHRIAGLIDNQLPTGDRFRDYPLLADDDGCRQRCLAMGVTHGIVAIGDNYRRSRVVRQFRALFPELRYVSAIHPAATLARGVSVGDGTVVMAGVCINTNSRVGRHCIVNTLSCLEHDSGMADFSSLAPGSITGGGCRIGNCSAIGIGAILSHGVSVGEHSVIGAGATVLDDVASGCVSYGTPARVIRRRDIGDAYL